MTQGWYDSQLPRERKTRCNEDDCPTCEFNENGMCLENVKTTEGED